jgi:hypothetical protein
MLVGYMLTPPAGSVRSVFSSPKSVFSFLITATGAIQYVDEEEILSNRVGYKQEHKANMHVVRAALLHLKPLSQCTE